MEPVCILTAGAAGPRLFTIHQIDANANNLPKAHTWCVLHAAAHTHACTRTYHAHNLHHDNGNQYLLKSVLRSCELIPFLQLQSDWHSALRELWQALRQAADGDRGDVWLRSGMRDALQSVFVYEHVELCAGFFMDYYCRCGVLTDSLRVLDRPAVFLFSHRSSHSSLNCLNSC